MTLRPIGAPRQRSEFNSEWSDSGRAESGRRRGGRSRLILPVVLMKKKEKRIKMKFGVAKFSLTVIKKQCTIVFTVFAVSGNLLLRVSVAKEVFYG